ncbi:MULTISPECIES: hypothetical protein [unclassified Actinomyces]|uniref:hypothetical protein n=1 Tax=unclassified Actinomyces TaxID=2609248 RepID=UPI002017C1E8|nr:MULTISPECIES: hypothetical protein [unclassified Actinomyces]MCL3777069.1 hypothetical protein [Actinomyces sp. AC-20-1]MCL3790289.1 hypothetical protein [Actinomyces sp. 187325]MCL3791290.1 hypothetical protein [Actinomyces sp. 186855]MCL3793793.1 hypothetical protein [Actinomyces sp. 217892]
MSAVRTAVPTRLRPLAAALCDERGAAVSGLIAVMAIGLLSVGVVVMLMVGDAVAERRSVNTAADAAALAAADHCADQLEDAYRRAVLAEDPAGFWAELGQPVSTYCSRSGIEHAVTSYAAANNATVTDIDVLPGLRFRVEARSNDTVYGTDLHNSSMATAQLDLASGACVSDGLLGVKDGRVCRTEPEEVEPAEDAPGGSSPEPSESAAPTEPPQPPLPRTYTTRARIDTRLVTD